MNEKKKDIGKKDVGNNNKKTELKDNEPPRAASINEKVWKVVINYSHGQSFTARKIFEGIFYQGRTKEIARSIAENITPYWRGGDGDTFFIDCANEKIKQKLLTEVIKKSPGFEPTTVKNSLGASFGYNITIKPIKVSYKWKEEENRLVEKREVIEEKK